MAIKEISYRENRFPISYNIINLTKQESILILHGWGSNKELMKKSFEKSLENYKHIYIDLPGFGRSYNNTILTTFDYMKIVKIFLKEININPFLIIGHSFGGKVATILNPKILVLLSSAGILTKKPWSIKIKISTFKILKKLGLTNFKTLFASSDVKNMSQNMYETFKNVVDEDFSINFKKRSGSNLIFWGESDTATPLYTGKIINNQILKSKFFILSGDHFFFLKHINFISSEIENMIQNITGSKKWTY